MSAVQTEVSRVCSMENKSAIMPLITATKLTSNKQTASCLTLYSRQFSMVNVHIFDARD